MSAVAVEPQVWMYHKLGVLPAEIVPESEIGNREKSGWTRDRVPMEKGVDSIYEKISYHKGELAKYEAELDQINDEIDRRAKRADDRKQPVAEEHKQPVLDLNKKLK